MDLKPLYRCVAALDVHQSKLTVCILQEDDQGELTVETRAFGGFKRDRRAMAHWVASLRPQEVVMERTGIDWQSPYAALERQGIRALVVSDIHGQSARAMIKGLIAGECPQQVLKSASTRLKASDEELLDALDGELSDEHRFVLAELMAHLEELERRIERFSRHLVNGLAAQRALLQALQTIPGLDERGAAMLLVEIGDEMQAFGSAEKLASWAGVCPGNHASAGKRKTGKARKGNPYVRRILCEAANAAARTRSALANLFKALLIRRGRKRAIVALAHKILNIVFVLISRGDHYRDATVDYEALSVQRNAPRWIRMLKKYGYLETASNAEPTAGRVQPALS
jgi:transposase